MARNLFYEIFPLTIFAHDLCGCAAGFLAFLLYQRLADAMQDADDAKNWHVHEEVEPLLTIVHEMQKERGMTAKWLSSRGSDFSQQHKLAIAGTASQCRRSH